MDNFIEKCPAKMSDGRFLTDYRSSHTRELYNMSKLKINNASDYRLLLEKDANKIMDKEWCNLIDNNSCKSDVCFHQYKTSPEPFELNEELVIYNKVKTGKMKKGPVCNKYTDYRLTMTPKSNKKC